MNVCKEHFVAYIDIMGFSSFVKDNESGLVYNYLAKLVNLVHDLNIHQKIECSIDIGSDTIVLSVPIDDVPGDDDRKFGKFINYINLLQLKNIVELECLPLRGGVTVGEFYTNEKNILFGKAYIEAYLLEKDAKYPRILVVPNNRHPDKINNALRVINFGIYSSGYKGIIPPQYINSRSFDLQVENEHQHCNYLRCLVPHFVLGEQWDCERVDTLTKHKEFIEKKLNEGKAKEKYEWMKDYHNWFCSGYPELSNYSI